VAGVLGNGKAPLLLTNNRWTASPRPMPPRMRPPPRN